MASDSLEDEGFIHVAELCDFVQHSRKRVMVKDRDIFLLKFEDNFYAIDSLCYHAGGPLFDGDIEDLQNIKCIKFPWHSYRINITNGEGLYKAVDPYNLKKPPQWKSKGVKQRTHIVKVVESGIYVKLSQSETPLESDHYNTSEFRQRLDEIMKR